MVKWNKPVATISDCEQLVRSVKVIIKTILLIVSFNVDTERKYAKTNWTNYCITDLEANDSLIQLQINERIVFQMFACV